MQMWGEGSIKNLANEQTVRNKTNCFSQCYIQVHFDHKSILHQAEKGHSKATFERDSGRANVSLPRPLLLPVRVQMDKLKIALSSSCRDVLKRGEGDRV